MLQGFPFCLLHFVLKILGHFLLGRDQFHFISLCFFSQALRFAQVRSTQLVARPLGCLVAAGLGTGPVCDPFVNLIGDPIPVDGFVPVYGDLFIFGVVLRGIGWPRMGFHAKGPIAIVDGFGIGFGPGLDLARLGDGLGFVVVHHLFVMGKFLPPAQLPSAGGHGPIFFNDGFECFNGDIPLPMESGDLDRDGIDVEEKEVNQSDGEEASTAKQAVAEAFRPEFLLQSTEPILRSGPGRDIFFPREGLLVIAGHGLTFSIADSFPLQIAFVPFVATTVAKAEEIGIGSFTMVANPIRPGIFLGQFRGIRDGRRIGLQVIDTALAPPRAGNGSGTTQTFGVFPRIFRATMRTLPIAKFADFANHS